MIIDINQPVTFPDGIGHYFSFDTVQDGEVDVFTEFGKGKDHKVIIYLLDAVTKEPIYYLNHIFIGSLFTFGNNYDNCVMYVRSIDRAEQFIEKIKYIGYVDLKNWVRI